MRTVKAMNRDEARKVNGGKTYMCRLCGYKNTSYARVYANALGCMLKFLGTIKYYLLPTIII